MTQEEAVQKALEYVQSVSLDVGPIVEIKHLDVRDLDEKARNCPPELLETYHSVRQSFPSQWVIAFKTVDVPGQVSCPSTRLVSVLDTGEVTLV